MILLRDLSWPEDRAPLLALDTCFTSDQFYRLQRAGHSFTLEEVVASQPVHKCYPLATQVESLALLDWVQVASDAGELVGVVGMGLQPWNRRATLHHLYLERAARHRGIRRAILARGGEIFCTLSKSAQTALMRTRTIVLFFLVP